MGKKTEQKELLEEKYQILMDFMPGGVVIYCGGDGTILESRGLLTLLNGAEAEDQKEPVNFYQMLAPGDVDRVKEMIETQLEFLHSVFLNIRLTGADGEIHLCEYRGRILSEENGERIYMALLKDQSEEEILRRMLKQKEERLLHKDELIECFQEWAGEAAFTYDRTEDALTVVFGSNDGGEKEICTSQRYTAFRQEHRLGQWLDEESVQKAEEAYHALGGKKKSGSMVVCMLPAAARFAGRKIHIDYRAVLNDMGSVLYVAGCLVSVNE